LTRSAPGSTACGKICSIFTAWRPEVINEDYADRPTHEEPIWELAEILAAEMLEFADGLRARSTQSKN
jgi:hypothetical protein